MSSERPTLLLIHGFPLDSSLWTPQVEALSTSYTLLAPDLRGFGTDTREVPEVMTMEQHAEDLKDLLNERGIHRVVLCGLSMGGYIAMAFLARWPDRVAGLVLANTRATADDSAGKVAREASARDAIERGMAVIARSMVPKLLAERTRRTRPELKDLVETMIARQAPGSAAASARGMALRPDRSAWLAHVRVPALIITGSEDELMPLPTSQAMADAIPNAELLVIPEVGHLSNLEAEEAFSDALHRFMQGLTSLTNAAADPG